ncbi:MAG: isoleucine--tRNA ligase, partial [Chlamydiia bacterium]|nr:isoleucine--tRNA ligase [Chlamydiia bacterium]
GLPHYGHLLAGTMKDVVCRYKTMQGFRVNRPLGWDCHGLPVENEIEKAFSLSGAKDIEGFGIERFNEECRKIVLRYTSEWQATIERMGRWVEFDRVWKTMDPSFMESVWWVFKQLHEKGLVYRGFKVMPFSAKLGTPLSNFEAGENYKEVDDPALTVAFPLKEDRETALLAWTTTPWTLISNLALMVGPEIDYVKVKDQGKYYILAKGRLESTFKEGGYEIVEEMKGKELAGLRYEPLFPYFADREAFRVIVEESVAHEEGTGVVHSAPAFGEVDFYACAREGIQLVCPVDNNGRFTDEIPEYTGQFVKDADKEIIKRLKGMGRVVHHGTCRHRYPFCWRSDTPLIYKAVSTWFVAVESIKEKLLKANSQIHWVPNHLKEGRFGKWLEGARDWAISRNRYWGTPIPLWESEEGDVIAVGSVEELEQLSGVRVDDLHRHFVDQITFEKGGKTYRRIPEVFDCWFESGSMPYARLHYPFENEKQFENTFPADFIAEGLDQTRGWFYTLTILAAALFDQPAFKNVAVNGIILAEDGAKMSKRLKNYPDPMEVIHKYGADAIRLYMLHSPAVKGDDLCFSEKGVELVLRQILIPWWNAYSFFITYARIYNWTPPETLPKPDALIDKWMLSQLNGLIEAVEAGMNNYDLSQAVEPFVTFVDQLTNWYIRRSRRRFWEDEDSPDRQEAFATLYTTLLTMTKLAAPFVPFLADAMYRNLRTENLPLSVHLTKIPESNHLVRDLQLEKGMQAVQTTVSLGHSLRKEHKLKVRQPLAKAHIASQDVEVLNFLQHQAHLIQEELNVKELLFSSDDRQLVKQQAKPNFRILGKKVGKWMPQAKAAIEAFSDAQLEALRHGKVVSLILDENPFEITPEDVTIEREVQHGRVAAHEEQITIALDTTLSDDLLIEGLAREIVNKVNTMRRDAQFEVTDRISLVLDTTERVKQAYKIHGDYIRNEVLATSISFDACAGTEWDLNGEKAIIHIERN